MHPKAFAMAIENHTRQPASEPQDAEALPVAGLPALEDTILELTMTLSGIVGVILLIFAGLRLFGYR